MSAAAPGRLPKGAKVLLRGVGPGEVEASTRDDHAVGGWLYAVRVRGERFAWLDRVALIPLGGKS